MKLVSVWGLTVHCVADDNGRMAKGILPEAEFRRILEYERALSDRHERRFSLLIFSSAVEGRFLLDTYLVDVLKRRLRATDLVGWMEDGHIGVILPYSDRAGATIVANDVCAELSSRSLKNTYEVHTYPDEAVKPTSVFDTTMAPETTEVDRHRMMSLLTPRMPRYKRALDIAIAGAGLVAASPLMALMAVLIKAVSPGPVFFKQERVGYLGSTFSCWKFRTMTVAADSSVHQSHLSDLIKSDVPMTKLDQGNDSRLIPLGKFFRAAGLDELPQLFNVLFGEMSFVGPRPCIRYEYENYERWHKSRFDTLPGLTGLWQVRGKNHTTFSQMMRLDIAYTRTLSFRSDLAIVWHTLPVLVEQVQSMFAQRVLKQVEEVALAPLTPSPARLPMHSPALSARSR